MYGGGLLSCIAAAEERAEAMTRRRLAVQQLQALETVSVKNLLQSGK
ncbi:hypothetical protein BRYFOR_05067 [Marvinbryantia formatexigens DSM 14469]|uniref:Uncharacterized protein n=1 Tax=Marvinbryantia formatexigens DSM 14469 TaxID=478749 RepID=C6L8X8_9FIRM|nr:hypothetical protein BRYFOR_05067 [Marvinbryantia formatexigens DSM 14469]